MSSVSPPRRRFLPQPVESSVRTSKRPHSDASDDTSKPKSVENTDPAIMTTASKPRRFLPQPVEEITRTSRKKNAGHIEHSSTQGREEKSLAPALSDDSTPSAANAKNTTEPGRRFIPEPVETTNRSSRRKFAPEPVETTARSSKKKSEQDRDVSPSSRPRRKFAPEPVETTTARRRKKTEDDSSNDSPPDSSSDTSSLPSSRRSTGGRKFEPELIETAKGQYRHGKKEPSSPVNKHLQLSPVKKAHSNEEPESESRFSAANLAKRQHEEKRRHSYCIPNLPSIESDSSEEESVSFQTGSPSDTDHEIHHLEKITEQENTSFTHYVLSLADRKVLEEQAMAAYINEVPREQVNHFAVEEDDDDFVGILSAKEGADPRTFRRSSQDDLSLEMQSMRKHHEQLEKAKRELVQDTAGASRFSAAALAARHHLNLANKPKPKNDNDELRRMLAAASPPMLGDELIFPFTISPRMTRCDVDQAPRPRCADSDDEEDETKGDPSLWSASIGVSTKGSAGLWMGLCQRGDESSPSTPIKSGIQTPAVEGPNPFEAMTPGRGTRTPGRKQGKAYNGMGLMPITPPRSADGRDAFTESIDAKLERERLMEEEFPNSVITQIYNYLSLGYPSLARGFDEELSKISRISIEELRKDDRTALENVKGYVGAPETEGNAEYDDQGALKGCRRWDALRLYVREWARQRPTFETERPPAQLDYKSNSIRGEAWGNAVRRGSWAQ